MEKNSKRVYAVLYNGIFTDFLYYSDRYEQAYPTLIDEGIIKTYAYVVNNDQDFGEDGIIFVMERNSKYIRRISYSELEEHQLGIKKL